MSGTAGPGLEHQLSMNRVTWEKLREHGLEDGRELSLDFFFFAPGEDDARALASYLEVETDYEVEVLSAKAGLLSRRQWVVGGSTRPAPVTLDVLDEWVTWMVAAGRAHGCEFDGWGALAPDA